MAEKDSTSSSDSTISYGFLQETQKDWKRNRFGIWQEYAANTTLHGPNHITSTSKKWKIYYIVIIVIMTCLFIGHSSFLIYQYLQFPINTDVKYQNILYSYPDITLCPNSGSSQYLLAKSKEAENIYKSTYLFWQSKKVFRESVQKTTKRSFLKHFYRYSNSIGRLPHHHILWCQINDQSCLDQIIITEHPTYYRCFTLRPKARSILAGPTHGITLVLHRGDPSPPILQVNEQYSYEEQASITNDTLKSHSGFIIGFHEHGSFPNFPLIALPAAIELKFGERIRISLDLTSLKAANLRTRPCKMTESVTPVELIKSDPVSSSNDNLNPDVLIYSYIRQSCIAIKRQELIFKQCGCFSEEYNIPYHMLSYGNIWCFDVEGKTDKIINIDQTIACVNKLNKMTENKVLFNYVGGTSKKTILHTFSVCPLRCDRFIHLIHSLFKDKITHSIQLTDFSNYFEYLILNDLENHFLNSTSIVQSDEVIVLDISAVSEHVNEVVEARAFNMMSLISQIGGISGLYVGVTLFTVFEVLDFLFQWSIYLCPICFSWMSWKFKLIKGRYSK